MSNDLHNEGLQEEIVVLLPRLRRFTRALTGSTDAGDDLAQSTCERALKKLEQFRPGTRLDSWIFRIAKNIWIDQLRSKSNQGNTVDLESWSETEQAAREGAQENYIKLHNIDTAMTQLSEEQRCLLALVCIEGFSYKEASALMEIPVGTVMSRLARARLRLAELLNEPDAKRT